jgi:hypothetical protein
MSMAAPRYQSFEEFWPFYLGEHSKPVTRGFHYVGTAVALVDVSLAVATRDWRIAILAPVTAYGCAWVSHFFIEKNRPATFTYPRWSLLGDFKMLAFFVTGRMGGELTRLRISPVASRAPVQS